MTPPELDDEHVAAICRVLTEHEVAFVVIGGVAARLLDTGHPTIDIDVCPSRTRGAVTRDQGHRGHVGEQVSVWLERDAVGIALDAEPCTECPQRGSETRQAQELPQAFLLAPVAAARVLPV